MGVFSEHRWRRVNSAGSKRKRGKGYGDVSQLFWRLFGCVGIFALSFFVTLELLKYFDVSSNTSCAGAACCPKGQTIVLAPPLSQLEGYAYKVLVPELSDLGDMAGSTRSPAVICEGDHVMGPGHTPFAEVVQKGFGRFSHYNNQVVFSSSDNTDPNSNGRQYKIVIPFSRCRGLVFLLALC